MRRDVGQASHIMIALSTQQLWVPSGTRKLNCNDWWNQNDISRKKCKKINAIL